MRLIAALLLMLCGVAHAQPVVGPCMQQAVGGCILTGGLAVGSPVGGIPVAGNINVAGQFLINGVPVGTGSGTVVGPASSTNGYVPQWNGATGSKLSTGLPVSTSGHAIPLLDGINTWTNSQTFSGGLVGTLTGGASLDLSLGGGTVTGPTTFSSTLTGTLTGGASLDLPLIGGTVTGPTTFNFSGTALILPSGSSETIGGTLQAAGITSTGTTTVQAGQPGSPTAVNNAILLTPAANSTASFTGAFGATFTGTGSGTSLTASSVTGVIHPGSVLTASISGAGVPANTYIVSQSSGTTGGAGVYVTNNATTSSGASIQATSDYLDITGSVTNTIGALQFVYGAGVATDTVIQSGSSLTWLTNTSQVVAAEAMTSSGTVDGTISATGPTGAQGLLIQTQSNGGLVLNAGQNYGTITTKAGFSAYLSTPLGNVGNGFNNNSINNYTIADEATYTGTTAVAGFYILHNIFTGSSGPRFGLETALNIQSGQTITGSGIYSGAVFAVNVASNTGDSSTFRAGYFNGLNIYCQYTVAVTNAGGCSGQEIDLHNQTNAGSTDGSTALILQSYSDDTGEGRLGNNHGIVFGATTTSGAIGFDYGILLQGAHYAFTPYSVWLYGAQTYAGSAVPGGGSVPYMGSLSDVAGITMHGCTTRGPYESDCPMTAQSITSATRLTTDGSGTGIGFIEGFNITAPGSLYTAFPMITTPTGCTPTLAGLIGAGGIINEIAISTPATNCPSNTTVAVSAPGGAGATAAATPIIQGNVLNFAINSAIEVECHLVAQNTGTLTTMLGEHIFFGATQGATPGTTAIVGSPAWVSDATNGTPTITFGVPTADTTLGAINITVTPSAGTWKVGGWCHMTRSTAT